MSVLNEFCCLAGQGTGNKRVSCLLTFPREEQLGTEGLMKTQVEESSLKKTEAEKIKEGNRYLRGLDGEKRSSLVY